MGLSGAAGVFAAAEATALLACCSDDGYADDGSTAGSLGYLYKVHVRVTANRSQESDATLYAANGRSLFAVCCFVLAFGCRLVSGCVGVCVRVSIYEVLVNYAMWLLIATALCRTANRDHPACQQCRLCCFRHRLVYLPCAGTRVRFSFSFWVHHTWHLFLSLPPPPPIGLCLVRSCRACVHLPPGAI